MQAQPLVCSGTKRECESSSKTSVLPSWLSSVTVLATLIAVLCICVSNVSADAVAASEGGNNARRWSNGVGLWGKRSTSLAFAENPETTRYLAKRPEDSWNKLNSLWGKRSSSSWQAANGLWGKRSATPSSWSEDYARALVWPSHLKHY